MTLLDRLQAHKGGLIQIKTELYWYDGRGWDGVRGRLCLVLDAALAAPTHRAAASTRACNATRAAALLLVDGQPRWVWVVAKDIELLDGGDR